MSGELKERRGEVMKEGEGGGGEERGEKCMVRKMKEEEAN